MMLQLIRSSLLALLLALVLLQKKNAVVSAAAACSACGDGFVITKPNVNVTTNNGTFTCAEIQLAAASGFIPASECPFIPVFVFTPCDCVANTSVVTTPAPVASPTTAAPVTTPTTAPVSSPTAPTTSSSSNTTTTTCAICAAGQTISKPNVLVKVPNTGTFSCSQIASFAALGSVPPSDCSLLPKLATTCGCTGGSSSSTTSKPTKAPVAASTTTTAPSPSSEAPTVAGTYPPTPAVTFQNTTTVVSTTNSSSSSNSSTCSICAAGQTISKPDVSVTVPNTGTFTCSQIETFAAGGSVPSSDCDLLPKLATECGCTGGSTIPTAPSSPSSPVASPIAPSTTPVTTPTSSNSSSGSNSSSCSICATGKAISKPNVQVTVPGTGTFSCSQIETFASTGSVPPSDCSLLPKLATECGCVAAPPSAAASKPVAPSPPSPVSSEAPTLAGTYPPTPYVTYTPQATSSAMRVMASCCSSQVMMMMTWMVGAVLISVASL